MWYGILFLVEDLIGTTPGIQRLDSPEYHVDEGSDERNTPPNLTSLAEEYTLESEEQVIIRNVECTCMKNNVQFMSVTTTRRYISESYYVIKL